MWLVNVRNAVDPVTVYGAVDGAPRRRPRKLEARPRTSPVETVTVDPRVMLEARRRLTPGRRLVIESATSVVLRNTGV